MVQQVWRNLQLASANFRFHPEHDVFETLKKHSRASCRSLRISAEIRLPRRALKTYVTNPISQTLRTKESQNFFRNFRFGKQKMVVPKKRGNDCVKDILIPLPTENLFVTVVTIAPVG
jgi:hypothetical protein